MSVHDLTHHANFGWCSHGVLVHKRVPSRQGEVGLKFWRMWWAEHVLFTIQCGFYLLLVGVLIIGVHSDTGCVRFLLPACLISPMVFSETAMTFCAVYCSKLTGQMFIFQGMYVENLTSDCVIYRTRLHCLFVDQVISETFSWEGSFFLTSLCTKCLISTWFNML